MISNDVFLKVPGNSAMWHYVDGYRTLLENQEQLYQIGLRRVVAVTEKELAEIPTEKPGKSTKTK